MQLAFGLLKKAGTCLDITRISLVRKSKSKDLLSPGIFFIGRIDKVDPDRLAMEQVLKRVDLHLLQSTLFKREGVDHDLRIFAGL